MGFSTGAHGGEEASVTGGSVASQSWLRDGILFCAGGQPSSRGQSRSEKAGGTDQPGMLVNYRLPDGVRSDQRMGHLRTFVVSKDL